MDLYIHVLNNDGIIILKFYIMGYLNVGNLPPASPQHRLIVVSSRARNKMAIYASVLPNVIAMEYSYETNTIQDISELIKNVLQKVISI